MKSSFKIKYFLPAIIWSLLILLVSYSVGGINFPPTLFDVFETDKLGHFGIYAILYLLIINGLRKSEAINSKTIWLTLTFCALYGLLMEVLQYAFFPGRYFEFPDIVANIIGALTGLIFYQIVIKRFKVF